MEVDAFRRLFPVHYYERLSKLIRPMLDPRKKPEILLWAVASSDGSALAKIGSATMLAAIKMEVMTPSVYSPSEGSIVVEFHMPPICSPVVRPGRPAEVAPELSLIKGKAAWVAYLYINCLDADGALFNAALLSAVAAFSHLDIPVVSLNDEGRMVMVSKELEGEKRKLLLKSIPFSLTCVLHKNYYILADPTFEEESIMETFITVVLNSSAQLVSLYKPGGQRRKELQEINEAISTMEID
ncbi:hypothetical protein ACJRO7_000059 [Eucalyptus globulus]|uniref:Ribosomal RNA-processing protein 43 n=1 Tax=Eucalyptus globulus TaxID=34317 RepID=A0ABD3LMJ6_EUCGL